MICTRPLFVNGQHFKSLPLILQSSREDIHREIFSRLEPIDSSNIDMAASLMEVEGATLGILMEQGSADYIMQTNCELYSTGNLGSRFYGLAVPKGNLKFCLTRIAVIYVDDVKVSLVSKNLLDLPLCQEKSWK